MPTLAGLGEAVRDQLLASRRYSSMLNERSRDQLEGGQVPLGNVEMWLSSLVERQPFVSRPEAFRNQALFEEVSRLLVGLVREAQEGFWSSAPPWLRWLVHLWHRRRATIITFNYDTIVEETLVNLDAPGADGDIIAAILTQLPRRAVTTAWGDVPSLTFRLLKLHGSLDWYWNTDDPSGESLCRLTPGTADADARAALAGKVPFIVPPLATKASFYSLGLVRLLWEEASVALETADRIVVLGYSAPLTDLATGAMLSQTANPAAEWHVVDPDAQAVADRLHRLGISQGKIELHRSLEAWVDRYEDDHCSQMSTDLLEQLEASRTKDSHLAPIMVRRTRSDYLVVNTIKTVEELVLLEAHALGQGQVIDETYPREPDLIDALGRLVSPNRVRVRVNGTDRDHDVLGALDPQSVRGANAVLHWCPIEAQSSSD